jgi:hypothetical protein
MVEPGVTRVCTQYMQLVKVALQPQHAAITAATIRLYANYHWQFGRPNRLGPLRSCVRPTCSCQ